MTPLERAVKAGDLARAQSIQAAKVRAQKAAKARRRDRQPRAKGRSKEERNAAWSAFVGWVHDVVWRLSQGRCEHCCKPLLRAEGEMDHARGGAYRRESTRINWCRRLCHACHELRTANRTPEGEVSSAYWLANMEAIRTRRIEEQSAPTIAALTEAEAEMLAAMDPRRRMPSVPVRVEVRDG